MDSLEGLPPQEIQAEQAVLGSMLVSQWTVDEVTEVLEPVDFYRHEHQEIYRAILILNAKNDPVDIITVTKALKDAGSQNGHQDTRYLMDLASSIPTAVSAPYYAKLIKQASDRRKAIALGGKIIETAHNLEIERPLDVAADLVIDAANQSGESDVQALAEIAKVVDGEIEQAIDDYNRYNGERITGRVMTGIYDLDRFTLGFGEDHLIIVAGRPGTGKTSLMFQIGKNIAAGTGSGEPLPVVAFSLEMGKSELFRRLACGIADVDGGMVTQGYLTPNERDLMREAGEYLAGLPFYVDDNSSVTVARIRNVCRKIKSRHGKLGAVIVDYIGLMAPSKTDGRKHGNRQEEVSAMSRGLKMLGRELCCPMIVGAQLNRQSESQGDKRPMLSHLRESGALEQDANLVAFLYRDDMYNQDSPDKGTAEVILAKHRGGRTGTVKLGYNAPSTSFYCLAGSYGTPAATYTPPPTPPKRQASKQPDPTPWAGTQVCELGEEFE